MSSCYKSTNALLKHLRTKHSIKISGGKQKKQLINQGYFHGYKGYRFFNKPTSTIPFTDYEQINQTILFDAKLKSIFYEKIMFIETAIKSIVLQAILDETKDESIDKMFQLVIQNYGKTDPFAVTIKEKREAQQSYLNLRSFIISKIASEYKNGNPKVTHFYETNKTIPLWALFDILMLGDFGRLYNSLTFDLRDKISKKFNIDKSIDSSRAVLGQYVYWLKDLRNEIAHNGIIYDARFKTFNPKKASIITLEKAFSIIGIDFSEIGDFALLIDFIELGLGVSVTERKNFVRQINSAVENFKVKIGETFFKSNFETKLTSRLSNYKVIR